MYIIYAYLIIKLKQMVISSLLKQKTTTLINII